MRLLLLAVAGALGPGAAAAAEPAVADHREAPVLASGGAGAPAAPPAAMSPAAALAPSRALQPPPRGEAGRQLPIVLRARTLQGQLDIDAAAVGEVELQRGALSIRADRLTYDIAEDRARASGGVRIDTGVAWFSGPEVELAVQRFEGHFLEPRYELVEIGAGGRAERVDFLGPGRSRAFNATYTSCPRDGPDEPDWVLKADRVQVDLDANEGVADGAVLRFLGMPILALPAIGFPLGDARKSGWLPPSLNIDNRSGFELSVPYYWNIAPNRDATLAPRIMSRRGFGLDAEFRYLETHHEGELRLDMIPDDRVAGIARGSLQWVHASQLPWGLEARADVARVSDADWWRDFPNRSLSLTTRLLPGRLAVERPFGDAGVEALAYARLTQWQVQQDASAPIETPFERSPQLGVRASGRWAWLHWTVEAEYNRFTVTTNDAASPPAQGGDRAHLLGSVSLPWRPPGAWVVPKLGFNAAAYDSASLAPGSGLSPTRVIPTFSVDAGIELERETEAFGMRLRQTLEPRLLYVNTPYRAQSGYPSYDAWAKDYNFVSAWSDNPFAGVDRVADTHQIVGGITTRLVDRASGAEALRLGLVQKVLLRTQQVAPQADGRPDGPPLEQRFSDALLLGSTSVVPGWAFDAAAQYSPDIQRTTRSLLGVRYSPGPFRNVGAVYRYSRGLTEQVGLGWQWPLLERTPAAGGGSACHGSWYSVGRLSYSLKDRRLTDSILGVEYDAGCWIGRFVVESVAIGRSEASTRLLLQLELVGLSRLGTNPIKLLRDNVPGYQVLREDRPR